MIAEVFIHVSVERDWLQIGIAVVGTVITLAAVAVALWGPAWRERRSRPRLTLAYDVDNEEKTVVLSVTNEASRRTAEDVEIYVRTVRPPSYFAISPHAPSSYRIDLPLRWNSPQSSERRDRIPPGFTRSAEFIAFEKTDRELPELTEQSAQPTLQVLPSSRAILGLETRIDDPENYPTPSTYGYPVEFDVSVAVRDCPTTDYGIRVAYFGFAGGFFANRIDVQIERRRDG